MPIRLLCLLATLFITGCANPLHLNDAAPQQPEGASGYVDKPGWVASQFAVAAANPLAANAGYQILKAGGSAVDAAIAVQMVLALVEPQSSGLGGGSFLVHFDGKTVDAFDGRETAPAQATENLLLDASAQPLPFMQAVVGGRSVGTPGTLRMLELAHQQHGKLPWAQLFEPAIALAQAGFAVSARMHTLLASELYLKRDPVAARYFYDESGQAWPVGHPLKNPELAAILGRIAQEGAAALMTGEVAQAIVNKVQQHPTNPGLLSRDDLAHYQAKKRQPLCFDYSAQPSIAQTPAPHNYRICGMPAPSSGTIAIAQILGMLNNTPAAKLAPETTAKGLTPGPDWLHLYTEAARLAFADRSLYLGDPDFVAPPGGDWMNLLAPNYLAQRSQLISTGAAARSMKKASPGQPAGVKTSLAPSLEQAEYGTSHVSIIDGWGNALAMTSTIEDAWGARQMVNRGVGLSGGFLLNNELTDFSFMPREPGGAWVANRVQGNKRPRSSMSPVLVFEESTGKLILSGGSPGGALIIHFTAKVLYGVLNWGLSPQAAINLPNFGSLNGPTLLEAQRFPLETVNALKKQGHEVQEIGMTSGLQAIQRTQSGLLGGADPRREGVVLGD